VAPHPAPGAFQVGRLCRGETVCGGNREAGGGGDLRIDWGKQKNVASGWNNVYHYLHVVAAALPLKQEKSHAFT
jgi:hypothetical protein